MMNPINSQESGAKFESAVECHQTAFAGFGKTVILGGTRGLGAQLRHELISEFPNRQGHRLASQLLVVGRRIDGVQQLQSGIDVWTADLADSTAVEVLADRLLEWRPKTLFYVAGGGPWGPYARASWAAHHWALQLNLLTPMYLLHRLLRGQDLTMWVGVGSAIAESRPDPRASAYAAAKHGLCGWMRTLMMEQPLNAAGSQVDVRLFSPGYMNTDLLPHGVREELRAQKQLLEPESVARDLLTWCQDPTGFSGHRICLP